jgi:hypothetical protein
LISFLLLLSGSDNETLTAAAAAMTLFVNSVVNLL